MAKKETDVKLKVLGDRVLVEPLKPEEMTRGGSRRAGVSRPTRGRHAAEKRRGRLKKPLERTHRPGTRFRF
jgi:hypothetical protein